MSITTLSKTAPHMASKKQSFYSHLVIFCSNHPIKVPPLLFDPHRSTVTIHSLSFLSDCITHGGRTAVIHSRWAERELTNRKRHQHHRPGVSKKPDRYIPPIYIRAENTRHPSRGMTRSLEILFVQYGNDHFYCKTISNPRPSVWDLITSLLKTKGRCQNSPSHLSPWHLREKIQGGGSLGPVCIHGDGSDEIL